MSKPRFQSFDVSRDTGELVGVARVLAYDVRDTPSLDRRPVKLRDRKSVV